MPYRAKTLLKSQTKDLAVAELDGMIETIDHAAAIDHVLASINRAHVVRYPFPHLLLENVFDQNTYNALLQLVELDDLFYDEIGGEGRYTIFRYPEVAYDISPTITGFIDFLARDLNSFVFYALLRKFADELLTWGTYLKNQGAYLKPLNTLINAELRPPMHSNASYEGMTCCFEIMRRTENFAISTHCHPIKELMIGLFPIVRDNSLEAYGTELFAIKRGGAKHMDKSIFAYVPPETVERVGRTQFLPNSCFMMLNCNGIHAYNPPAARRSRNYIYTTLCISDAALAIIPSMTEQERLVDMQGWRQTPTLIRRLFGRISG
jgi:hypothetical protein